MLDEDVESVGANVLLPARHSTEFSSRGSYYDDYEQTSILRGR